MMFPDVIYVAIDGRDPDDLYAYRGIRDIDDGPVGIYELKDLRQKVTSHLLVESADEHEPPA